MATLILVLSGLCAVSLGLLVAVLYALANISQGADAHLEAWQEVKLPTQEVKLKQDVNLQVAK